MNSDVVGITRIVTGFYKQPDEDGDCPLAVEYVLKPLDLAFLQKLFNIDPNDPDPGVRDIIDCYRINETQAKALQPYVIDGVIDVEKYNFLLGCYANDSV